MDTTEHTFDGWLAAVDRELQSRLGADSSTLRGYLYYDRFCTGMTAEQTAADIYERETCLRSNL